jgi:hypothetical protein
MRNLQKIAHGLVVAGVLLVPLSAAAAGGDDAETQVRSFLLRYEQVLSEGQVDAMSSIYVRFPPEREAVLRHHFTQVVAPVDVDVDILDLRVLAPNTVRVQFDRVDTFVDRATAERLVKRVRLTRDVLLGPSGWRLHVP